MPDEFLMVDAKRWLKRLGSAVRLRRVDRRPVPDAPGEIRLFAVVRNEMLRLPYFFRHYRDLGVGRFFVVDNDSSDGSLAYCLEQPDAHVYRTRQTYVRQEQWVDVVLRRHGCGHWCLVVDADEFLSYPHRRSLSLPDLCRFLDERGHSAMHCILLDMYPEGPLSGAVYRPGQAPMEVAPWFDTGTYTERPHVFRRCRSALTARIEGGMRRRVFGRTDTSCSKFPLVRFGRGMFVTAGAHLVEGADIPALRGVLFHWKFLHDFAPRVAEEAVRGEHWQNAREYKAFDATMRARPGAGFVFDGSRRFEDEDQLVRLGLMASTPELDARVRSAPSRRGPATP
jgi:hypothetical protein